MPFKIKIDNYYRTSDSVSTSDFKVRLRNERKIKSVTVKNVVTKFSWYPIDSTNNTLIFTEAGGNLTATILPPVTWTGADIATAVAAAMTLAGTQTYTGAYSSVTFKYTFTAPTTNFTLKFATGFTTSSLNTINRILGFTNSDTSYTGAKTYTATNVGYTFGCDTIVIKSHALTSGQSDYSISGNSSNYSGITFNGDTVLSEGEAVLVALPVNCTIGGTLAFLAHDLEETINYFDGKTLLNIDIKLVNPWTNAVINNNGADISILLSVV